MKRSNALCLFVKAPIEGTVKTRLMPELEPNETVELHMAMGQDIINQLRKKAKYDLWIFYTPENALEGIRSWLGEQLSYLAQSGNLLGDRMVHAFQWSFERGYEKTLIIGGDTPTINTSDIGKAYQALDNHDVVIGPAEDGGYYLIGLKKPQIDLFENISWSSDSVFTDTLQKIKDLELTLFTLPERYDIDSFDDLVRLSLDPNINRLSHIKNFLNMFFEYKRRR